MPRTKLQRVDSVDCPGFAVILGMTAGNVLRSTLRTDYRDPFKIDGYELRRLGSPRRRNGKAEPYHIYLRYKA